MCKDPSSYHSLARSVEQLLFMGRTLLLVRALVNAFLGCDYFLIVVWDFAAEVFGEFGGMRWDYMRERG